MAGGENRRILRPNQPELRVTIGVAPSPGKGGITRSRTGVSCSCRRPEVES